MDEYVPWPDKGCDINAAVSRLAAGHASSLDSVRDACIGHLSTGELIAYGRAPGPESTVHLIKPATWAGFKIDWPSSRVLSLAGVEVSEVRIFPTMLAPCRVEILDQMPIVEAFRRFVLNDPEVKALATVALPRALNWAPFFDKGQSINSLSDDWPVDLDRWWFAKPVHPNPAKQSLFEDTRSTDSLELVMAVEAVKHRYRSLITLLQMGTMSARGIPGRSGLPEQILRSVWSHEGFHLRVSTGDVLQDNDQSVGRYDRLVKTWAGVVLCKPNELSERTESGSKLFHVNTTGPDVLPPNTRSAVEVSAGLTKKRIETVTTSLRECQGWLTQLMRNSPVIRTATIDELWDQARRRWPNTLSRRGFEKARADAIKETGAVQWTAAGRSRKSSRPKSPR